MIGNDGGVYSRPVSKTGYGDWSDLNATLHNLQFYDASAGREHAGAVVLHAAPERQSVAAAAGAGVVELQVVQRRVQVGPVAIAGLGNRPGVHATVVTDHDVAIGIDEQRVLVGVGGLRAARAAGQAEVPVWARRREALASVGGLEDLLQADEDSVRIAGVDHQRLVVPSLHADVVAGRIGFADRGSGILQLGGIGQQRPRAGRATAAGHVETLEVGGRTGRVSARGEVGRRLHQRVQPAVTGVGQRGAADIGAVQRAGRGDRRPAGSRVGAGEDAVFRRAAPVAVDGYQGATVRARPEGYVSDVVDIRRAGGRRCEYPGPAVLAIGGRPVQALAGRGKHVLAVEQQPIDLMIEQGRTADLDELTLGLAGAVRGQPVDAGTQVGVLVGVRLTGTDPQGVVGGVDRERAGGKR